MMDRMTEGARSKTHPPLGARTCFRPFGELCPPPLEVILSPSEKPPMLNMNSIMSAGLVGLYDRIRAKTPPINYGDFTDSHGDLIFNEKLPLLAGRYKALRVIGKGSFSQLMEAVDTFRGSKRVAIKVMHIRQHDDAQRQGIHESRCISRLNSIDALDHTHIVRLYNTFYFGGHFCLVLELLYSNLIEHIKLVRSQNNNHSQAHPVALITASTSQTTSSTSTPPTRVCTPTEPPAPLSARKKREMKEDDDTKAYWRPVSEKRKVHPPSPYTSSYSMSTTRKEQVQILNSIQRAKPDPHASPLPAKTKRKQPTTPNKHKITSDDHAEEIEGHASPPSKKRKDVPTPPPSNDLTPRKLSRTPDTTPISTPVDTPPNSVTSTTTTTTSTSHEMTSLQTIQQHAQQVQPESQEQQTLLPMWFIRSVASQLIAAVGYLFQKGMMHADLKPENIMFRDNPYVDGKFQEPYLKLVDFGNAIAKGNIKEYYDNYEVQSPSYRAPEVVCGVPFGLEIDMWSIGCILAQMCNGMLLFPFKTKSDHLHRITRMFGPLPEYIYSKGKFYSSLLVPNCAICNYDPKRRPTPQQALQHPFFAPLFTFSVFGSYRVGDEIRRIHHDVNAKAMKVHMAKNSETARPKLKNGCILYETEPSSRSEEPPLPPSYEQLEQKLGRAHSLLAQLKADIADHDASTRTLNGKVFDYTVKTNELTKENERLRADLAKRSSSSKSSAPAIDGDEVAELHDELARRSSEYHELNVQLLDAEESLKANVRTHEKEIVRMRKEHAQHTDAHRKAANDLQKEVASLRAALSDAEKTKDSSTKSHTALKAELTSRIASLEEEVVFLRQRVAEWNEEKIKFVSRESTYLGKITSLEKESQESQGLRSGLAELKAEKEKLESSAKKNLATLQRECADLRAGIEDKTATCTSLTNQLATHEAREEKAVRELELKVVELKKGLVKAQGDADKRALEVREKEAARDAITKQYAHLESENEQVHKEMTSLQKAIDELRLTLEQNGEQAKKEAKGWETQVAKLKSQVVEAKKIVDTTKREKEAVDDKLGKSTKEVETLKLELTEAEASVDTLKKQLKAEVGEVDVKLKKVQREKDELQSKYSATTKQVSDLMDKLAKEDARANALANDSNEKGAALLEIKKEVASLHEKLAQKDSKLAESEKAGKKLKAENDQLEKHLAEKQREVDKANSEVEKITLQLKASIKENDERKAEKQAEADALSSLEQRLAEMEARLQEEQTRNSKLTAERDEIRQSFETLKSESESAQRIIEKLKSELEQKNAVLHKTSSSPVPVSPSPLHFTFTKSPPPPVTRPTPSRPHLLSTVPHATSSNPFFANVTLKKSLSTPPTPTPKDPKAEAKDAVKKPKQADEEDEDVDVVLL